MGIKKDLLTLKTRARNALDHNNSSLVKKGVGEAPALYNVSDQIEKLESPLPDWDDDSPIIATGNSYHTDNTYWELTEKGTLYWRIKDVNYHKTTANFNSSSLAYVPLEYQAIASKIRQAYISDGITNVDIPFAVNCERIRIPDTLTKQPALGSLVILKEVDFSNIANSVVRSSCCNGSAGLEKVVLNPTTDTIDEYAFKGCYSLKEIELENITTFGVGCLRDCFSFDKDITFNSGLISIGNGAFQFVRSKSIKFQVPTGDKPTIGSSAFAGCRRLTTLDLYNSWDQSLYLQDTDLTQESLHKCIEKFADMGTVETPPMFYIGTKNIAKIDETHLAMLDAKGWSYK